MRNYWCDLNFWSFENIAVAVNHMLFSDWSTSADVKGTRDSFTWKH